MQATVETMEINGVQYVRADAVKSDAPAIENGLPYVIVRTQAAGVFAGLLEKRNGAEVVMRNARRLWMWVGAASLSQLCMEGVKKPNECKFPCSVNKVELLGVIEILNCTEAARTSIADVPAWKE